MKAFHFNKAGVIFSLLLFFITLQASENKYILHDEGLVDPRASEKIFEIGSEVEKKIGSKIYLYLKYDYGISDDVSIKDKFAKIKEYESNIVKELDGSYVLITMSLDHTHVNLYKSSDLNEVVDKDDILNGYIIPLLASKDKNTLLSKTSAAMLNGYAQIGDVLAENKGIKLDSSLGSGGKTAGTIWKVFMYFLVIGGLLLYTYAVLKSKKRG